MLLATVAIVFVALILLSMPIVFALGVAGIAGLWIGGYPMQQLASALVSGSQSWVLLAIPAFVFAGNLMERCGMSHALVELARALIGAAIGIQSRSHFALAVFVHRLPLTAQLWIHRFNHALISGVGLLAAWYGFKLCLLNRTLTTPGLEINLAWLYASSVVGGILIAVYGFAMMISPLPQGEPQH